MYNAPGCAGVQKSVSVLNKKLQRGKFEKRFGYCNKLPLRRKDNE
nr:MAG TPA: hypothetical protein [Caudoviricetes sp.]